MRDRAESFIVTTPHDLAPLRFQVGALLTERAFGDEARSNAAYGLTELVANVVKGEKHPPRYRAALVTVEVEDREACITVANSLRYLPEATGRELAHAVNTALQSETPCTNLEHGRGLTSTGEMMRQIGGSAGAWYDADTAELRVVIGFPQHMPAAESLTARASTPLPQTA